MPATISNSIRRSLRPFLGGALIGLLSFLGGPLNASTGPDPDYAPRLEGTVFNVKDYGAVGDDVANDTAAIRAALDACRDAGGGTVYIPAGTYRLAPTEEDAYTFVITFGNVTIEGDGYDKTKLDFYAWDMQDPEGPVLRRGGGFKIRPISYLYSIDGVTLRGFHATGNADPTGDAGNWWGDQSKTGWDISHKGLGIWGEVDNVIVEDCEFDSWRGEIIYAGGGLELGKFSVVRSIVHGCNASAISMGGEVLVENTEIYAVYNATECLSMGAHQKLTVRNCVIEPSRDLPEGVKIAKFGIVYAGFRASSLTVENNFFGETHSGAIFLSEWGHNIRIANNTFQDTVALYGIFLNLYKDYYPDSVYEKGWTNFDFVNNVIEARYRSVGEVILFHTGYLGEDWRIVGNELRSYDGFHYNYFIRTPGVAGEYLVKDNIIEGANPVRENSGPRPTWINNKVTGYYALGSKYASYTPKDDPAPIIAEPTWPRVFVGDLADGTISREFKINPSLLSQYPTGFEVEIRRTGTGANDEGLEIKPDTEWNSLDRGYMVYDGAVLTLVMGEDGKFGLKSFVRETTQVRTLTTDRPKYNRDYQDISVYGQPSVKLAPRTAHTFNRFSGVPIGETITIEYNDQTTIAHVPGVIEIYTGEDFVATEVGTLKAIRVGDTLKIVKTDNKAPLAGSALVQTEHSKSISFDLPASDPDGDPLTVVLAKAPTLGSFDFSALPLVTFNPLPDAVGAEEIVFTVSDGLVEATGSLEVKVGAPAPEEDSDRDGYSDQLEILFGSNPMDPTSRLEMKISHNRNAGVFELHLPMAVNASLRATIESSQNMLDWSSAGSVDNTSLATIDGEGLCISVPGDPNAEIEQIFFRLSASEKSN